MRCATRISRLVLFAEYKLKERLPEFIQGELPSIEEIEQNMEQELKMLQDPLKVRMEGIIQKLASMQVEEIRTAASYQNRVLMFDQSVKPLFKNLFEQLGQLAQYFLSTNIVWYFDSSVDDFESFEAAWKDESRFSVHKETYVSYTFSRFRKAGVNAFDIVMQLHICLDQYQYGVKLVNYNNQRPFIKKLYHEALTASEIQKISEICCSQIMDHIAWQVDQINPAKTDVNI